MSLMCQPTSENIKLYIIVIIIRLSVPFMVSVDVKHHVYFYQNSEVRSCVKVEVDVLGFPSLIVPTGYVDVKLH